MSNGLRRLGIAELRALRDAVEQDRIATPVTATGLRAAGFGPWVDDVLPLMGDANRAGVLAVLRATIAEREHQRTPRLELVWTGPIGPHGTVRDTAVVVRQLFARARRSVLIGGFRFDAGADLFAPLHEAMVDHGVKATVFLDIEGVADTVAGGPAHAAKRIAEFYAKNWPFDGPRPEVYYDPRTAVPGPPWVSLHAKCVVVDERWSFVTSANFTDRGQTRNIELGVLIEDPAFAQQIVTHWRALVRASY
ncbi:MAG: DISARM system phospholipase D-like protein DrmC [Sandaracinaceae bacterium]|nr:DISARM system phospholipase D-like protein DrmC [Sandaracinaceae bacterium]